MIERKFVAQKLKEYEIEEFISNTLRRVGHSHTRMMRTPLGEKIIIHTSRPGLIVGKKGQNIRKLTKTLKNRFGLENPQIEIAEVKDVSLDPQIIGERISNSLERFGTSKFKGIGHKILADVIAAGALGVEVVISGKIPSARAKRWRFYQGYLKKSGDIAVTKVRKAYAIASLKTGIVGIQVRIMTPDIVLPDKIKIYEHKLHSLHSGVSGDSDKGMKKEEKIESIKEGLESAEGIGAEKAEKSKKEKDARPKKVLGKGTQGKDATGARVKKKISGAGKSKKSGAVTSDAVEEQ